MATTPRPDQSDDENDGGSQAPQALTVETARLAHTLIRVVAAFVDLSPDLLLGRRPAFRVAVVRKLSLYILNAWMGAQTLQKITGFNAAHINREVAQVWRWAENNAHIEALLERVEAFFVTFPEAVREIDELTTEMLLELAEDRVRRAADKLDKPATRAASGAQPSPAAKKAPIPTPARKAGKPVVRLVASEGVAL